jgi:hypothetical protein
MFIALGTLILTLMFLPFIGPIALPVAALATVGTWFIAVDD